MTFALRRPPQDFNDPALMSAAALSLLSILILAALAWRDGWKQAPRRQAGETRHVTDRYSLPSYHVLYRFLWVIGGAVAGWVLWQAILTPHDKAGAILTALLAAGGFGWGRRRQLSGLHVQGAVETSARRLIFLCSLVSILITAAILLSILIEALRFFDHVPLLDFLFGLQWSPQMAIRADQAGAEGAFGLLPLLAGTLLITVVAMAVAVPVGLFSAIYLAEYASSSFRAWVKPALEILAGIPTVVYGYLAVSLVAPFLRDAGASAGIDIAAESALVAGLVMGVMIIPFMSSLSDDVIHAVPQLLRDASYGLGATRSETIRKVVLPAALPGIMGAFLMAVSRAIGETMIVVMAAGLAANLTLNPLEPVTTVTAQIVALLVGDQSFDSPKTLASFALGLALFVMTLALNVLALMIVKRYREHYE